MGTTEEALPGPLLYLRVYFLGMVPTSSTTWYRRAAGHRRLSAALYFLMAASLCNIVLDLLLVVVFHMGVAGVAWATLIAQGMCAVCSLLVLIRR